MIHEIQPIQKEVERCIMGVSRLSHILKIIKLYRKNTINVVSGEMNDWKGI